MNPTSEKIIIVDDEKRMCDSLSALLSNEGYQVEAFQNSSKAAEAIRNSRFDLVISDIKMPELDGLSLLQIVKDIDEDIPVILMTGYASLDSALEAISKGAYDYLMKPVEFTQLDLAVKRAIEKRRSDLARYSLLEELKISNMILHRRINELNALYEAGKSIGSTSNLRELLRQIVSLASHVTEAKVGSIMLLDSRSEYLTIEAAIGLDEKIIETTRLPVGESIAGSVAQQGEPLIVEDVEADDRFKRMNKDRYGSASLLCAPLKIKNRVIGVINMANKTTGEKFDKNDLRLLTTFAAQAAVAVDDANQFEKKRRQLTEYEILHELAIEMNQVNNLDQFRKKLLEKLSRVFPVDYAIWFSVDCENKLLVTEHLLGETNIPLTESGKLDLKKIGLDKNLAFEFDENLKFDDIEGLSNFINERVSGSDLLPVPDRAFLGIPIYRNDQPAYIFFIATDQISYYTEDDISLAKLVISQSAILFEKERTMLNATRLLTMGNMISEISHDLRRPLTTIKGGLQIMRERLPDESQNSELFVTVEDEVLRMNELVRELVDFSNPNKYQTEKVDLRTIIEKAADLVNPDLRRKNISFMTSFEELEWKVIVNKNQVMEMFLNLFINAIDAMDQNGKLSVEGLLEQPEHKKDVYLAVRVKDTGSGIKPENIHKVFDRYFTTKSTGTGLGLAVVERIISAHGGTLKVDSKEGEGTTFTIYFTRDVLD